MLVCLSEKYRFPFLHVVFLFSKFWVSDSKLWWIFPLLLTQVISYDLDLWEGSTYLFSHKPLSEGLSASPNIFCFLRRGIMESALCVLVDCPPVWSCLQVLNLGFSWGWGYVEKDSIIYKGLFSRRIFRISKQFRKIILMFIQNKLVLKNSSYSHR